MKRKSFKELGTPTAQAAELGSCIKERTPAELLTLAQHKHAELEAAGEFDTVGDEQDAYSSRSAGATGGRRRLRKQLRARSERRSA